MVDLEIETMTPIQQKILDILSDGSSHGFKSIKDALGDSQFSEQSLRVHLTYLRKKSTGKGLT